MQAKKTKLSVAVTFMAICLGAVGLTGCVKVFDAQHSMNSDIQLGDMQGRAADTQGGTSFVQSVCKPGKVCAPGDTCTNNEGPCGDAGSGLICKKHI